MKLRGIVMVFTTLLVLFSLVATGVSAQAVTPAAPAPAPAPTPTPAGPNISLITGLITAGAVVVGLAVYFIKQKPTAKPQF